MKLVKVTFEEAQKNPDYFALVELMFRRGEKVMRPRRSFCFKTTCRKNRTRKMV